MDDKEIECLTSSRRPQPKGDDGRAADAKAVMPYYTFKDVKGVMNDGTSVLVGVLDHDTTVGVLDHDTVNISFDYRDRRDGVLYHVEARGWRARKDGPDGPS